MCQHPLAFVLLAVARAALLAVGLIPRLTGLGAAAAAAALAAQSLAEALGGRGLAGGRRVPTHRDLGMRPAAV